MSERASAPVAPDLADDEPRLLAALRRRDEAAFEALVRRHHASLRRVVRAYVSSDTVADEVVQETWLAVIRGLDRFGGRSSLKTWIFQIAKNIARTRGAREARVLPIAALGVEGDPAVPFDAFQGEDDAWPGHWAIPPRPWQDPERRLASLEARERLLAAIDELPEMQRVVLTCRDVEGMCSEEVCDLLGISRANERVILHRARTRMRASLADYLDGP
jgi:RNA polymerase sigma-70 factor, ECF subfamily